LFGSYLANLPVFHSFEGLKTHGSIILLALFTLNTLGFYPLFQFCIAHNRSVVKQELLSTMPESKLVVFYFTSRELKNLEWYDANKEFVHNGKMYDLVRLQKTASGKIKCVCFSDANETGLRAEINTYFENEFNSNNAKKQSAKSLLSFVITPVEPVSGFLLEPALMQVTINVNTKFNNKALPAIKWVNSPPPEIA
jgi:hypothetical protein